MDNARYEAYQEQLLQGFDEICRRCGECCGAKDEDPCANLAKETPMGQYYCRAYEDRLGSQKTVSGKIFHCIPIRVLMREGLLRPNCAYRK